MTLSSENTFDGLCGPQVPHLSDYNGVMLSQLTRPEELSTRESLRDDLIT